MRATLLFLIGLGVLSPAGPGIQDAGWEGAFEKDLDDRALEIDGRRGEDDPRQLVASEDGFHTGALAGAESFSVSLEVAGLDQVVLAVCDEDCEDIDFYLYDSAENEVCVDVEVDARPTLAIPDCGSDQGAELEAGAYELELYMASCDIEPCYYAVKVYDLVDPGR